MVSLLPHSPQNKNTRPRWLSTALILITLSLPVEANLFGAVITRLAYDIVSVNNSSNINSLGVLASGGSLPVGTISDTAGIPSSGVLTLVLRWDHLLTVKNPICNTNVTQGVLYDMGFGCSPTFNPNTTLPTPNLYGLPKVALIRRGGPGGDNGCSFRSKILLAINGGAVGAIIYNSPGMGPIDGATAADSSSDPTLSIPGMIVSYDSGLKMRALLQQYESAPVSTNGTAPPANSSGNTRVRIGFSTNSNMSIIWEIILIVVLALLGTSFAVSVIIHFRLYTLRRRYRAEVLARGGEILPNGRIRTGKTLEKAALDELPVRVFGQGSSTIPAISAKSPMDSIDTASSTVQPAKLEDEDNDKNGTEMCQYGNGSLALRPKNPESVVSFSARSMRSVTAVAAAEALDSGTNANAPANMFDNDTCAICIDEFVEGDQIRTLPCHHEYHCECIGKLS
ncbi:hypothetical protein BGZ80_010274 [Entomortierella chlamydospora]|uniref:RING-type domain-containing protein n=1 Tax=Entomortierella chlamydospora TaxID=101097 RepID=A0A9P6N757_9FUNG|nr:hypothetical protein BGZ80_010274 [Entomortierella chlamydospora]